MGSPVRFGGEADDGDSFAMSENWEDDVLVDSGHCVIIGLG